MVELPSAERFAFIRQKSNGDNLIIDEVLALLDSDENVADFIENPLVSVSRLVADETSLVGKQIGSYKIEKEIGRGGMGAVYLASRADEQFEKLVAIKLIKRGLDTDDIIRRFRYERQILAALDHPNITRLLDGGVTEAGSPYLVMDFVDGLPVNKYCTENRLSVNERLKLFLQVCAAVIFAHQNLIIHRDIKPSNIFVTTGGVPKLLDFGIAKLINPDLHQTLDRNTTQVMTPEYASPEQIMGQPVTTSTDIYSLGIVLYELMTGERPFKMKSSNQLEMSGVITDSEPQKPSSVAARKQVAFNRRSFPVNQLRGDLDNIILMAIRKEPDRRYVSVEQFAADINRYLKDLPVLARQDSFGYRASKFIQRNKAAAAAGAGILAALVAGLASTKRQARIAQRQRDRAEKTTQFLQKMLASADPRVIGKDVKVIEVLSIAAQSIETDFANQPEIAANLEATLGLTYLSLGQLESAEKHLKSALEMRLYLFPRKSVEVAQSLNNYGKLLLEKGDIKSAEDFCREGLETLRNLRGKKCLEITDVLDYLADLAGMKGKYDEAIGFYREELEIQRTHLGEDHPQVARTMGEWGRVLTFLDKRELAEPLHRHALKILREFHGGEHPDIVLMLYNLVGTIYIKHSEEAEQLGREALVMSCKIFGDDNATTAWSQYNLAHVLIHREKHAEAEQLLREVLAKRGANLPDKHHVVGSCLLLLGRALMAQGEFSQAKTAIEECSELRRRNLPEGHWHLAAANSLFGECLMYLGETMRGEKMMLENYQILKEKLGAEHEQTRQAEKRVLKFFGDKL